MTGWDKVAKSTIRQGPFCDSWCFLHRFDRTLVTSARAIAKYDKAMIVTKLRGARDRMKAKQDRIRANQRAPCPAPASAHTRGARQPSESS
jgi:hypothetical protein